MQGRHDRLPRHLLHQQVGKNLCFSASPGSWTCSNISLHTLTQVWANHVNQLVSVQVLLNAQQLTPGSHTAAEHTNLDHESTYDVKVPIACVP